MNVRTAQAVAWTPPYITRNHGKREIRSIQEPLAIIDTSILVAGFIYFYFIHIVRWLVLAGTYATRDRRDASLEAPGFLPRFSFFLFSGDSGVWTTAEKRARVDGDVLCGTTQALFFRLDYTATYALESEKLICPCMPTARQLGVRDIAVVARLSARVRRDVI